ncbi:outer membrane usher protein [Stenotrophomonas chelatiphaga]|uniref:fimbria/pilus outer membrane usher protein n=1 Tax=Stenotrophomonas chelatiphaga TaxID=517011 RepID=UPI0011CD6875|nr:outer membrane usher protein [Stenotrophomonas chelatiphaga]
MHCKKYNFPDGADAAGLLTSHSFQRDGLRARYVMSTKCVDPIQQLNRLAVAVAWLLAGSPVSAAAVPPPQFSAGFMLGGKSIDTQHYLDQARFPDGVHALDVVINGERHAIADIAFESGEPCIGQSILESLGLKADQLEKLIAQPEACSPLGQVIEGATVVVDQAELALRIGIPQAALASSGRGDVPMRQRDQGITAGFIDYSFSESRSQRRSARYLALRTGLNAGAWRLRHRAALSQDAASTRYAVLGTELQRDLPAWNSQLVIGQAHTGGELFAAVGFTGVRIATDERMLPDALRGYAPAVRGVANSNARVSIHQNGLLIHEVHVAPGPFLIDDLYPTSFGGDLQVTVTEADGREQRFRVGFSAAAQALRPGATRLSATGGTLREAGGRADHWRFVEATYARGISNPLTLLAGTQLADHYVAALVGAAFATPLGAVGLDLTRSRLAWPGHEPVAGNSIRLNYQRSIAATGSHVAMTAHRYSRSGFVTLAETARADVDRGGVGARPRQRYQATLSQPLGSRGSLFFSGGRSTYGSEERPRSDMQLGFQGSFGHLTYGLSVMHYQAAQSQQTTHYALTASLPLGNSAGAPRAHALLNPAQRSSRLQLGLSGTAGETHNLNYSASAHAVGGQARSFSSNAAYRTSAGTLSAGYSQQGDSRSGNLGVAGSVVIHAGGVTAGPSVSDGFALIQAKGARGARVGSADGIRVSRDGFAVLPHISPYRWNRIELEPADLPLDVELQQTAQRVAPTAGSIVRVTFTTRTDRTLFIDATDAAGQPLPFAAALHDEHGHAKGAVGQGGVIQLRGASDAGVLIVDPHGPHRCRLQYRIPTTADAYGLLWDAAQCLPFASTDTSTPSASAAR